LLPGHELKKKKKKKERKKNAANNQYDTREENVSQLF
jgi:hypothetical protein